MAHRGGGGQLPPWGEQQYLQEGYGEQYPPAEPKQQPRYDPRMHAQRINGRPPQQEYAQGWQQYPPQSPPWQGQPPQPPRQPRHQPERPRSRRSWIARHKVLTGFVALWVVIGIAVGANAAGGKPSKPQAASPDTQAAARQLVRARQPLPGRERRQRKPARNGHWRRATSLCG
jgi:hypothetical protein